MANYQEAKKFYQKYGHFPCRKENPRIYLWAIQWWRRCYLNKPQGWTKYADKLTAIGFVLYTAEQRKDQVWMARYERARQFYERTGHFPSLTEDCSIHEWACAWSSRLGHTDPVKLQMLAEIGYVYQTTKEWNEKYWNNNYQVCKTFFDEHGHFPTAKENKRIHDWAGNWWRRSSAKHPDRVSLLKEIGFKPKK